MGCQGSTSQARYLGGNDIPLQNEESGTSVSVDENCHCIMMKRSSHFCMIGRILKRLPFCSFGDGSESRYSQRMEIPRHFKPHGEAFKKGLASVTLEEAHMGRLNKIGSRLELQLCNLTRQSFPGISRSSRQRITTLFPENDYATKRTSTGQLRSDSN
jgi:hypothetical protein